MARLLDRTVLEQTKRHKSRLVPMSYTVLTDKNFVRELSGKGCVAMLFKIWPERPSAAMRQLGWFGTPFFRGDWIDSSVYFILKSMSDKKMTREDAVRVHLLIAQMRNGTGGLAWTSGSDLERIRRQEKQVTTATAIKRMLASGEIERRLQSRGWYRWYKYRLVVTGYTKGL